MKKREILPNGYKLKYSGIFFSIVLYFVLFIVWIKPNMKDIKKVDKEPTNADRLIGQEGIVTEAIDPIEGKGQIKVMGQVWSASCDKPISKDCKVIVKDIKGVKLVVETVN